MRAGLYRLARGGTLALAFAFGAVAVMAQEAGETAAAPALAVPQAPVLMVDRNRLLTDTLFAKAEEARFKAESEALIAENVRLEQALEAEERDLTDKRSTLPAEEFQTLAAAFDAKTEQIRAAQDAKSREITARREAERQKFLQAALPVLGDLMREAGAVAIFDKDLVILSLRGVDITDEAVARIDEVLGDGSGAVVPDAEPSLEAAPAPEAAVEPATEPAP